MSTCVYMGKCIRSHLYRYVDMIVRLLLSWVHYIFIRQLLLNLGELEEIQMKVDTLNK